MNKNMKIVLKLIVVIVILLNLPFQNIYSESVENVVSSLTTTNVKKQLNGKSIYIIIRIKVRNMRQSRLRKGVVI